MSRFHLSNILWLLMQVGIFILTSAGLLVFGMIAAGFIKQMENLEATVGDELARGRKFLEKFRRLKKGFSPFLFAEFSANTFVMVVLVFKAVGLFKSTLDLKDFFSLAFYTLFAGVQMLYIGLVAEETKSKFENILPFLRLSFIKGYVYTTNVGNLPM